MFCKGNEVESQISNFGKQNSTLGSAVPLAMFFLLISFTFIAGSFETLWRVECDIF